MEGETPSPTSTRLSTPDAFMSDEPPNRRQTGDRGEQLAADYLREEGWEILERNFECDIGELDIIARRTETLGPETFEVVAFVEVKARTTDAGIPTELNVTTAKRRRIVKLGKLYLNMRELSDVSARFDIVTVDFSSSTSDLSHYPAAFDALGRFN